MVEPMQHGIISGTATQVAEGVKGTAKGAGIGLIGGIVIGAVLLGGLALGVTYLPGAIAGLFTGGGAGIAGAFVTVAAVIGGIIGAGAGVAGGSILGGVGGVTNNRVGQEGQMYQMIQAQQSQAVQNDMALQQAALMNYIAAAAQEEQAQQSFAERYAHKGQGRTPQDIIADRAAQENMLERIAASEQDQTNESVRG
jgi:hypothetical protein